VEIEEEDDDDDEEEEEEEEEKEEEEDIDKIGSASTLCLGLVHFESWPRYRILDVSSM